MTGDEWIAEALAVFVTSRLTTRHPELFYGPLAKVCVNPCTKENQITVGWGRLH